MMKMNYAKMFVTAVASLLSSVLGILYVSVLLMVACNVIDYIMGLLAAPNRSDDDGKISSYKSMRGIIKKVTIWLLVVVWAIMDQLLRLQIAKLGKDFTFLKLYRILNENWKIIKKLCKASIVREWRKPKKTKKKLDEGTISHKDIEFQYQSWRRYNSYTNSYNTARRMDKLYNELTIEQFNHRAFEPIGKKPDRFFRVERKEEYGEKEKRKVPCGERHSGKEKDA